MRNAPDHWREFALPRLKGPAVAAVGRPAFLDNWMKTTGEVLARWGLLSDADAEGG